jgi:hypothetical protein
MRQTPATGSMPSSKRSMPIRKGITKGIEHRVDTEGRWKR